MPIIRSGYRSDDDKRDLKRLYDSSGWKRARAAVLARAGGKCEFCGLAQGDGPIDVAHLTFSTLRLLRSGRDPLT